MRIAVWHNLPSGGGKRALHDHLEGLAGRGHEIEIWNPPTADGGYLPLGGFGREHSVALDWPVRSDWRDRLHLRPPQEAQLNAMEAHARRCAEEIGRGGFDVLFANSCQYFRTTPIGRLVDLPSVLYLQEPFRWLYEAMPRLPWVAPDPASGLGLRRWRRAAADQLRVWGLRVQAREELRNARAFDRILVNSFFSRESVLRAYGLESDVCYLGVDLDRFRDRGEARQPTVLGLGSFTPEKGVEFAIRAVAALPEPRPRLVWIGNYVEEGYLTHMTALAAELGVVFEPKARVSDATIFDELNSACAMIYAPRLEPFGLAPIEAGACGLPVVAVAEGGVRETVVDSVNGLVVEPRPTAAAAALARLFNEPELYARLRAAARRDVVAKWSLEAATDRIEAKLFEVAGRDRTAA